MSTMCEMTVLDINGTNWHVYSSKYHVRIQIMNAREATSSQTKKTYVAVGTNARLHEVLAGRALVVAVGPCCSSLYNFLVQGIPARVCSSTCMRMADRFVVNRGVVVKRKGGHRRPWADRREYFSFRVSQ